MVFKFKNMGPYKATQRIKDGYYDANALLYQWNKTDGNTKREMKRFLDSPKTIEYIEVINNSIGNETVVKIIKGINTKDGRTLDQVWMHPYLFIDFAMYLSPSFKLTAMKFLLNGLLDNGNKVNRYDKKLSTIGSTLLGYDHIYVNSSINFIVYDSNEKRITENSNNIRLLEVIEIQNKLIYLIEDGFITDYQSLIKLLRDMYSKKYRKF